MSEIKFDFELAINKQKTKHANILQPSQSKTRISFSQNTCLCRIEKEERDFRAAKVERLQRRKLLPTVHR